MADAEHLRDTRFKPGHAPVPRKDGGPRRGSSASLAKTTRTLIGDDGEALVSLWWSIANDPMRRDSDRLEASRLLADRGWGRAANFVAQEGDPLGLEDVEQAAEEFRRRVLRLAPSGAEGADPQGDAEPPVES